MIAAIGTTIAVTIAVTPVLLGGPVSAAERIPRICSGEVASIQGHGADTSALDQGVLTLDGRRIVITDDSASWRVHDPVDNTFNNRFHGMEWLVPWAVDGGPAIEMLLARDVALVDPGGLVDRVEIQSTGWTTGAVRLRQHVVNCLYALTDDPRLIPVVEGLIAANLDPDRYRGRPQRPAHNLGTLSNLAMIESAKVFDRAEWREAAFDRMRADSGSVFSSCGMTAEQSTDYHLTNVQVWQRALRRAGLADSDAASAVADRIARARAATLALARPDGILEAIGNGNPQSIRDLRESLDDTESASLDTRLWCRSRGWAANRTSWDDTAIHYTLRFGPRPKSHGHDDHGSITWFAHGVPVLSDPGLFDKARGDRRRAATSVRAHSVLHPMGDSLRGDTTGVKRGTVDTIDRYKLVTRDGGVKRVRHVDVDLADASLRVRDTATSRWPMQWLQRWQVAPGWERVEGTTAWTPIARHPTGLYLYAVCHSRTSMRMSVSTQEHYPKRRSVVSALSLFCGGMDDTVRFDTLLVVSEIDGTLTWDRGSGAYSIAPRITPGA